MTQPWGRKKRYPWDYDTYEDAGFDPGINAVVEDKALGARLDQPLSAPSIGWGDKVKMPGSDPTVTPTNPNIDVRLPSGGAVPELKIENQSGTSFTTRKADVPVVPGAPNADGQMQAPPLVPPDMQTNPDYDRELQAYQTEMARGPAKQGAASQILFQIAQGMTNFSRGMMGQEMQPFQWLGEAKDARRDAQAQKRFAPYEAERQRQIQDYQNKVKIYGTQKDAQKTDAEIQALNAKAQREANQVELEYKTSEGKTWSRAKGSKDEWTEETQLRDRTKMPIERRLPDGTPIYTTGDKEADRIATAAKEQAEMEFRKGSLSAAQYDRFRDDFDRWQQDAAENANKKTTLYGEADTLDAEVQTKRASSDAIWGAAQELKDVDPDAYQRKVSEVEKLRTEASIAEKKAAAKRKEAMKLKLRPAPKFKPIDIPTTTPDTGTRPPEARKVSRSMLEKIAKGEGMTVQQVEEMARRNKWKIED